jgi:hypothetical protein
MAESLTSTDCPFDEPCSITDEDGINWDALLFGQVGESDAFGPYSDRDDYPGPA